MPPGVRARIEELALRSTRNVDRGYRLFVTLRSVLAARLLSDAGSALITEHLYRSGDTYRPGTPGGWTGLFAWERQAVERFFPSPPGRVLVGGAGGGREALALAERGYSVVAFDPNPAFVHHLQSVKPGSPSVAVYHAAYQDLPILGRHGASAPVLLDDLGPFDAVVMGWDSLSHLWRARHRAEAVRMMARVTRGPILVSFIPEPAHSRGIQAVVARRLLALSRAEPGTLYSERHGLLHLVGAAELESLARGAGLCVWHHWAGSYEQDAHAVLGPGDRVPPLL